MENPLSVADYITLINQVLSRIDIKIVGEVSELKIAASGHVYFSLKDEKTGDIINCAVWNSVYRMCGVKLEDGLKIIVSGKADIYRARGTLTFKVRTVEHVGEGALKKAYLKLREKMEKEGFFDEESKREIPRYPQKIGVITSKKGAAIHDFINNLGKFGFKVYVCDSRVEGQEAVEDLIKSVKVMRKRDLDVLVVIRGGGSLQSLMAFDNEMLVRELKDFPVPVVAGIGHHEDVTLCGLAADASFSTPTAAASKISEGYQKARDFILKCERVIERNYENALKNGKNFLDNKNKKVSEYFEEFVKECRKNEEEIKRIIATAKYRIRLKRDRSVNDFKKIISGFSSSLTTTENKIENFKQVVDGNNPERQLSLGYVIAKKNEQIVKGVKGLKEGDNIEMNFFDGTAYSFIKKINKKYGKKR